MNLTPLLILFGVCLTDAGYGTRPSESPQSDVEAPSYVPAYAKNQQFTKTGYSGTKTGYGQGYSGTKTGYSQYSGTKTYAYPQKTSYSGTKTAYAGTKTGYGGTKTYTGPKNSYGENQAWYSTKTGNEATYQEFHNNAQQPVPAVKCEPACKNNGICVETNTCQCPSNFHGKYCEFEKKPCLSFPPLPMNSYRKCTDDFCSVTCMREHRFPDGSTVQNMRCVEGQWQSTRDPLMNAIPDCEPQCSPPCENGGVCLSVNVCQCPTDFRGPKCQYAASGCDPRKLAFNGGYNCSGDGVTFSCSLTCPVRSKPSSPLAAVYTCTYETAFFQPQPIPNCIYETGTYIITSSNHSYETSHYGSQYGHSMMYKNSSSSTSSTGSGSVLVIQDLTPKGGVCLTWAGVHYKTFDGRIYSFQSPCQHILLRDSGEHAYTVAIQQGNCERKAYCPLQLVIYLEDKRYSLGVGEDGSVAFRSTKRLLPIPASLPGIRVAMRGDRVLVNLDTQGVTLHWDTNNVVIVETTVQQWNHTEGLCGSLNGNPNDDLMTKEGQITPTPTVLASSWQMNKIGDVCDNNFTESNACASKSDEERKQAQAFCTRVFSKDKFRKCSEVMDVSLLLETCQWDYCACTTSLDPEDCACSTVSVYARECLRHGVKDMESWRDADTCPIKCPDGKIYKACGPEAQPSCAFPLVPPKPDNETCVEGCFCPEGLLLEGNRCVQKDQCPCRWRNKSFKPGAKIPKDCNECICEAGEWKCSQTACRARCSAIGDPHYTTFDGVRYDFMGHCTYTLLQSPNVTIEVENVACSGTISEAMNLTPYTGEGKPSCTKAITINYGKANLHLKQGGYILVNGQEVTSLPALIGDIKIRAASSLFLIIQLPNKVDVWWDGITRVFVDVPPEFNGQTKGLCGTFNLNQKDDFLTPEGDTEQSVYAFANKWKTREFCDDVMAEEPLHPCQANVQNKEVAEKYCSKLKSSLFESCHWHVDVEPYYLACVYDMCACAGDAARCLCPVLGDYGMACARAGETIQWRYNVKECELSCTGGQEYTVCADSCLRSCTDLAVAATGSCKPSCVEGCACPAGQVLDSNNVCVPKGMCPCYHKGLQFNSGYKEVRPGRRERELCTCVGARWECRPATPADIAAYPPADELNNCSAANRMEFTTCIVAEPLTCKNMHLPPMATTKECRAGCRCMKGFVLDVAANKCVLPKDCPCHHGGTSYPDGHVMQEECNTCECKSGIWECSKRACAAVCSVWGDSHVTTFDGAQYDFEGVCTYLLAKGASDDADGFSVEIQNVPCGSTGATCSKAVTLRVGEETATLSKDAPLPDLSNMKRIKLREAGSFVFLDVPTLGMSLQWDRGMRVYVKVNPSWQGRVKGLCGNYNADMRDDFQTPTGGIPESSALIFVNAWKLKPMCPKPTDVTDHCKQRLQRKEWAATKCGSLKRYPFSLCHSEVPPDGYIERCERDACACDSGEDCECACTALAAYAHDCAARGVVVKWRAKESCPMQCDEECWNYDACVSPCPLETCDNTIYYSEVKTVCQQDTCVEGCKPKKTCPEGSVYRNSSYTECVPRSQCRPVCMTLDDGREIYEGDIIEEDECHACRCSKRQKICSGQPCSTTISPFYSPQPRVLTTPPPHDESLKCVPGWTPWISRGQREVGPDGNSIVKEPLPKPNELQIGKPMCASEMMRKVECRTLVNHKSAKETGLNAECSLERGLVCEDADCPQFEIRVFCECEFQCLNSDHPNYPHPTDCSQFYECTPDMLNPDKLHTVLKNCTQGTLYNPVLMVCDWPASVFAVRPECASTVTESPATEPSTTPILPTVITTVAPSKCPQGQVYSECAYPCDQLCDQFKKTLLEKGKCTLGQACVKGCIDKDVAEKTCKQGSMWRDESTCVAKRDCTCYSHGKVVKPGGTVTDGCIKCQCLDNELHCDTSECNTVPPTAKIISLETTTPYEETTPVFIESTRKELPPTQLPLVTDTATPPPQCAPDGYINLLWGDNRPIFEASSQYSDYFKPEYAKLNASTDHNGGSWLPSAEDLNPYFKVTLHRKEPIYGLYIQGSPLFNQYITSYTIKYGHEHGESTINGPDGKPKVFRGPIDNRTPMKQMFDSPIEAKSLTLVPLTWHDQPALRIELIGCGQATEAPLISTTPEPLQCRDYIGVIAGLPLKYVEVSSNNDLRQNLLLGNPDGWRALYSTPGEWIMFDFTSPRNITGIITKGGPKGWVRSYNIMYTSDLSTFNPVIESTGAYKEFPGNFDKNSEVMNEFRPPIHARYLKVLPLKWTDSIEMRIEPLGCFEPYPISTTVAPELTSPGSVECDLCPGVTNSTCECRTQTARYYDGQRCVSRDQCPCIHNSMPYAVGSTFRNNKCYQCICKLGGISDCQPAKECTCDSHLVPKVDTSTCECLCEPCPTGTQICPTSKICLPLDKWCDGLQDCPDDELHCTTVAPIRTTVTVAPIVTTPEPLITSTKTYVQDETPAPIVTTPKPVECPKEECAPGYVVVYTSTSTSYTGSELPPPRPRYTYSRYRNGRGGFAKGGFTKGGYSKGGFSKGGYVPPTPSTNEAFSVDKPSKPASTNTSQQASPQCKQFKCVPAPPPPFQPPPPCLPPVCPPKYSLMPDITPVAPGQCPQYVCVPPPERPVYCNLTGSTINSFDGSEYKLDLCFHMLARENRFNSWSVFVRKICTLNGCYNELLLNQDDQFIIVKPSLTIMYNNYEYSIEQMSQICFQKNMFDVVKMGNGLAIKSRRYNFMVLYTADGDVKIGLTKSYMGYADGLCGAFDGNPLNDRRLPNGMLATTLDEFAQGWAKPGLPPNACAPPVKVYDKKEVWVLCDAITNEPFTRCAKVLDLAKWRNICVEKICDCTELVINGTKRSREECRCLLLDRLVAECLAGDKDVDLAGWRVDNNCPAVCKPPLVQHDCYRKRCEPTCGTLGAGEMGPMGVKDCPVEDGVCFPGCYCPEGTLRQGDDCITPTECLDCLCGSAGSPASYDTFEGDGLPAIGNCTYLASRDTSPKQQYQVYATNGPCEKSDAVCAKTLHFIVGKNIANVTTTETGPNSVRSKQLFVTVNGVPVFKDLTKDWITVAWINEDVTITLVEAHVKATITASKMAWSLRVPSHVYGNRTEGLCGVCASQHQHLVTSNGTVTDDIELYGKSWKASPEALAILDMPQQDQCSEVPPPPECKLPPPDQNPCNNLLNMDKFGACHALVDPQLYVEACEEEICASKDNGSWCSVLERYAAECRQRRVCVDWRVGLCPLNCEAPFEYHKCLDCEATCENYEELTANPQSCIRPLREGCFCPFGKVRVNNTCIEPTKCFPCDANKEHYAGDEWKEDACTTCKCNKMSDVGTAHVSCTTQVCATPVCGENEEQHIKPIKPGECCPHYLCVPKHKDKLVHCEEPKKMDCGFGQVLKQKTNANGCTEYACECKPASECERIPSSEEVEVMDPGMERVIDDSGCCPRAVVQCHVDKCPAAPRCPPYHEIKTVSSGACCPNYSCEVPKDKCIVQLKWEAAPKGGERQRAAPEVLLKDIEAVWLDGPCRSCRCELSSLGAAAQCSLTNCPIVATTDQFVMEPRPVPFACCPQAVPVACREGDNIYKVGEKWTSADNPCESYQCVQSDDGQLEKVTTVQACTHECDLGWKYFPAEPASGVCCGKCKPVACVCSGVERKIGEYWHSDDFCTNYTCVDLNGTLQVQSSNETCPQVSDATRKQFVLKEEVIPGKCCKTHEPVACRVGNEIYQEGQTWQTSDPCKNMTCARDESGNLVHKESVEKCSTECKRGQVYRPPVGGCCGHCVDDACVVGDELKRPGDKWYSMDNCTTYACERIGEDVSLTMTRVQCPDVSDCKLEDLVNETCCQVCRPKGSSLSTCAPQSLPDSDSVGVVRVRFHAHGRCVNKQPVPQFKECVGTCRSGTLYNNQTGIHESSCQCCQVRRYEPVTVSLSCEDGSTQLHRVASPAACACATCGSPTPHRWTPNSGPKPYERETTTEFELQPDMIRAGF